MEQRYEPANPLSMPFECFEFDSSVNPFPVKDHCHYFAETILGIDGTLQVTRGAETHVIQPGELLVIPPLMHHSITSADGKTVHYGVIKHDLSQHDDALGYAPHPRSLMLEAEQSHLSFHLSAQQVHEHGMDAMFMQCIQEYRERDFAYDLKIRSLLFLIFTALVRIWIQEGLSLQTRNTPTDPLYTITAHINRNIQESLKVEDLARHCGLSYPWFAKRFREIYGISCKEYIEKVRISKVEHYLLFTDYDLNYISQATGYADCSHMIKDFRRLKHTTPGQFRQSRKKEPLHEQESDEEKRKRVDTPEKNG